MRTATVANKTAIKISVVSKAYIPKPIKNIASNTKIKNRILSN